MRILLAEDEPVTREILRLSLEKVGHQVVCVSDGDEAWEYLQRPDCPSLAILDWMMPGIDGPELCRRVRALERQDYTYIILLTARSEGSAMVEGLTAGADDYIPKPFRHDELSARLRTAARILELQQQLVASNRELERRATHDGLTSVYNRTAILELLGKELQRALRSESAPVCTILLDVDHFKAVNDTYGHQAGDVVLQEVARRIEQSLRPYDVVGRYGGEEFLVVLSNCDAAQGVAVADRIRTTCSDTPFQVGHYSVHVSVSLGVAEAIPLSVTVDELIFRADMVLYSAKTEGRNLVKVWEPVI